METTKRLLHWCPGHHKLLILLLIVLVALESNKAALTGIYCSKSPPT